MANCIYCGKPAGFFKSVHAECENVNIKRNAVIQNANSQILAEALSSIKGGDMISTMESRVAEIEQANHLEKNQTRFILLRAWETAVDYFLEDGILDAQEEKRLIEFGDYFGFTQDELDKNGALTRTAKAHVLRGVFEGKLPKRDFVDKSVTINFQKDEIIVWVFPESRYLEDKTRRQIVGSSQGLTSRIGKGLYYRVGSFQSEVIETTERIHIDTGLVVVTSKNIYFAGSRKSLRVPYKQIITFEPFVNGIGIMRDTSTAKPQIFTTGDGWFTYNLVTNLSRL